VWVMAAGATNTNGKGSGVRTTSKGTVPADSMNTYAVGIEIGNNGVGEPYSKACIDAAFATSLVVTSKCGLLPTDVIHHQAYAPDRKVDPSTCTGVQGGWYPKSVTSSGTWSLDDLKTECQRRATSGMEDDDMPLSDDDIKKIANAVWTYNIDTTGADAGIDPQPARYWLQRTYLIVRQCLAGFNGKPATDPTMLRQIHDNTKK
jgi:N-acetylmuramoyl-L-alanine amidase